MVEEMGLARDWAAGYPFGEGGSALGACGFTAAWWLLPLALPLLARDRRRLPGRADERSSLWLALCGFAGFAYLLLRASPSAFTDGMPIGSAGLRHAGAEIRKGWGSARSSCGARCLLLGCRGLAGRGWCRGDAFIVSSIGVGGVLIAVFVFFPVAKILVERLRRQ